MFVPLHSSSSFLSFLSSETHSSCVLCESCAVQSWFVLEVGGWRWMNSWWRTTLVEVSPTQQLEETCSLGTWKRGFQKHSHKTVHTALFLLPSLVLFIIFIIFHSFIHSLQWVSHLFSTIWVHFHLIFHHFPITSWPLFHGGYFYMHGLHIWPILSPCHPPIFIWYNYSAWCMFLRSLPPSFSAPSPISLSLSPVQHPGLKILRSDSSSSISSRIGWVFSLLLVLIFFFFTCLVSPLFASVSLTLRLVLCCFAVLCWPWHWSNPHAWCSLRTNCALRILTQPFTSLPAFWFKILLNAYSIYIPKMVFVDSLFPFVAKQEVLTDKFTQKC